MLRVGRRRSKLLIANKKKSAGREQPADSWFLASRANLAHVFAPVFESLLEQSHKLVGHCTVDQAMIVAERKVHGGADRNGVVSIFIRNDHRLFCDPP